MFAWRISRTRGDIALDDLGGAIARAIVNHDTLKPIDADRDQCRLDRKHALDDRRDTIFFIVGWDNDGKGCHGKFLANDERRTTNDELVVSSLPSYVPRLQ